MANIGIVTTWFERGAAYVSKAYLQALSENNTVFIYARGGEHYGTRDPNWDLPNVTWAPRFDGFWKNSRNAISAPHLWKWLRRKKINVVIFNEERNWKLVDAISRLGYTVGAYIDYYTHKSVDTFRVYDFLLCNTKRHYEVFRNHSNPIFVQWGTDTNLFKPIDNIFAGTSGNGVTFFHSAGWGGVNCRKGTDLVVESFCRLTGDANLVIHSQAPIEHFGGAAKLILDNPRTRFIRGTVTAPGLYHLGDVFVYPSRLEGIGLCIAEALACGLPVITTDSPPMNEFIEDGHNGKLIKVSGHKERADGYYWPESYVDLNDLTAGMQYYVDHVKQLDEFKRTARKSAENRFDWRKNAADLPRILSTIVDNSKLSYGLSLAEVTKWHLRDLFLLAQKLMYDCGKNLPRPLAHLLNAPFRAFWKT